MAAWHTVSALNSEFGGTYVSVWDRLSPDSFWPGSDILNIEFNEKVLLLVDLTFDWWVSDPGSDSWDIVSELENAILPSDLSDTLSQLSHPARAPVENGSPLKARLDSWDIVPGDEIPEYLCESGDTETDSVRESTQVTALRTACRYLHARMFQRQYCMEKGPINHTVITQFNSQLHFEHALGLGATLTQRPLEPVPKRDRLVAVPFGYSNLTYEPVFCIS